MTPQFSDLRQIEIEFFSGDRLKAELVGTDPARILAAANRLLTEPAEYARRSQLRNPYGDGTAAARIARLLEAELKR